MAKSKDKIKNKFSLKRVLDDICELYPNINCSKIELFAPVYYPIANIELTLKEKSFEDFETVQLTILKLINLSYKKPKVIADLLGLNELYVSQIFELLLGYGYIDEQCNITDIGRESADKEKKISLSVSRQRFQMDAINCNLIKLDQELYHNNLVAKSETDTNIMILDSSDGVNESVIENEIRSDNFKKIYSQKSNFLHTNISEISDIQCEELLYAQCVFLKLEGMSGIIFSKRENFTKRRSEERYSWQPFAVDNHSAAEFLGLSDYSLYSDANIIKNFESILYSSETKRLENDITDSLNFFVSDKYKFNSDYISIDFELKEITLLSSKAFSAEIHSDLALLIDFYKYGVSLMFKENFKGRIIKIKTTDKIILKAANKIGIVNKQLKFKTIENKILDYIDNNDTDDFNIIEIINTIF